MLKSAVSLILLTGLVAEAGQSDSDAATTKEEERSQRLVAMTKAAAGYEIHLETDQRRKLTFLDKPVLRYTDQITKVPDGTLFVWTHKNRPEAIVCIWYHPNGSRYHEFQSLSRNRLTAVQAGRTTWKPSQPGVHFKPLAGAPPPAKTKFARLRQLRNIAREFSASVNDDVYGLHQLRLMPQPIFRYGKQETSLLDGAIFAFAKGTNPEVLLLVEALPAKDGKLQWHYAPTRMTSREIDLRRKETSVWKQPWQRGRQKPDEIYFSRVLR